MLEKSSSSKGSPVKTKIDKINKEIEIIQTKIDDLTKKFGFAENIIKLYETHLNELKKIKESDSIDGIEKKYNETITEFKENFKEEEDNLKAVQGSSSSSEGGSNSKLKKNKQRYYKQRNDKHRNDKPRHDHYTTLKQNIKYNNKNRTKRRIKVYKLKSKNKTKRRNTKTGKKKYTLHRRK